MIHGVILYLATMLFYGFVELGGRYGLGAAGIVFALVFLWAWAIGTIRDIEEYRQWKAPRWMIWLADEPATHRYRLNHPVIWKVTSAVVVVGVVIGSGVVGYIKGSSALLTFSVCAMLTWILGVGLIELYIRRNYTRIINNVKDNDGDMIGGDT